MNLRRSAALGLLVVVGAVVSLATPAGAHPLGNFSTNVYSGLRVQPDRIEIDHVVDLAEVPTFRSMSEIDADGDGDVSSTEASRHASEICERQLGALALRVAGQERPLHLVDADLTLLDGQAGLQTSRTECRIETETLETLGDVRFVDESFAGRVGWREVVVVGDGTSITDSDAPESSLSERLSNYPEDRLQSPLAQQAAAFSAAPGGDALGDSPTASLPDVPGLDWATDTFTGLVEDRALTVPFAAFAVVVAMVLGSLHAVAPGHGKTVMAAYIVGQHGTVGQALGLGTTVAVTHTAGVLALGVALSTTATFAPEALYPWLGLTSGLLVAAIGGMLLVRAVRNRDMPFLAHQHGDGPGQHRHHHPRLEVALADLGATDSMATVEGLRDPLSLLVPAGAGSTAVADRPLTQTHHDHDHQDHDHHDHDHDHHDHAAPSSARLGRGGVMLMGLAGGLVPSPSALVVLLGAIAIGRAWFGVIVIAAYGVGMALTLVAAGLLMARLRDRVTAFLSGTHPRLGAAMRYLPLATAGLVFAGGLVLSGRALGSF